MILRDALTRVCLSQVRHGATVAQDLPDYWDRVRAHGTNIEIRNVNTTDEGRYTLTDRFSRVVSVTRMDLTGQSLCLHLILHKVIAGLSGLQCLSVTNIDTQYESIMWTLLNVFSALEMTQIILKSLSLQF